MCRLGVAMLFFIHMLLGNVKNGNTCFLGKIMFKVLFVWRFLQHTNNAKFLWDARKELGDIAPLGGPTSPYFYRI